MNHPTIPDAATKRSRQGEKNSDYVRCPYSIGENYQVPGYVCWVQDRACLLLVNEATQTTAQLVGFPAALWDWLLLGYRYKTLIQFAAAWFAQPPAQVESVLRQQLHEWWAQGFLLRKEGDE